MAKPGRKPKPNHLKVVNGNPGKRVIKPALDLPAGAPSVPSGFKGPALAIWTDTVNELSRWGVLSRCDSALLEAYCNNFVRMRDMEGFLQKNGVTYETTTKNGDKMIRKRPEVEILMNCTNIHRQYMTEMGLTPSSRTRLPNTRQGELDLGNGFGEFK